MSEVTFETIVAQWLADDWDDIGPPSGPPPSTIRGINHQRSNQMFRHLVVATLSLSLALGCAAARHRWPPPPPPPPPTPPPTTSCSGITLRPTDATSINSTINSQPNGTTFCFESGTYNVNAGILLKDGDKLICIVPRSCIVEGANAISIGVFTAYAATTDQLVSGFVVQNFTQSCMRIRPRGRAEFNDVHDCDTGMEVDGAAVGNYIHHNRRYGVAGGPAIGILIEGNDIAFNNTSRYDPNNNAGGSKIVGSTPGATLTWRGNKVHDNYGNGIWQDGNVTNTLIESNEVYNNFGAGIFHEISWAAIIRNNTVYNNNLSEKNIVRSCWHGAQIAVNNSQNVEIYGNTVTAEYVNGICLVNSIRSESAWFPQSLANIKVHDNTVKMRGNVRTGFVGNSVPPGVGFSANTYYVNNLSGVYWQNMSGELTSAQWKASGQDTTGSFLQW